MRVRIYPSTAKGAVLAPPSKSVAHRALICGALTDGCSIYNCGHSQDIEATIRCLKILGTKVDEDVDRIKIGGLNPTTIPDNVVLDCGESGSTLRFLLPLCLLSGQKVTLAGRGRLMQRPMNVYEELCRQHGFLFEQDENGIRVCGKLQSGVYTVPGDVSSQFITGLLFALSQLPGESRVELIGNFESAPYVDITLAVFSAFGVRVQNEGNVFVIKGKQDFRCSEYTVESDCSNAAFLDAFNLLDGDVKVLGLSPETPQGDWVYKQLYAELAAGVRTFDLSNCPDLGPVMFALAAVLGGGTFTGTARLRMKESDRCEAIAVELAKFGISTEIGENTIKILQRKLKAPTEMLYGHNDHRVVMALSLLCTLTGGIIDGAEAVAKSFPHYFDAICDLGIVFEIIR